jgi:hypothetical protein
LIKKHHRLPLSILFVCILAFSGVIVADQVRLNDDEIVNFLADKQIKGVQDGVEWMQSFGPGMHTTYTEVSRPLSSDGLWKAENNRYCSQWPPANRWDCYTLTAEGDNLTFKPNSGGEPWPAVRQPN